ncbi:phosphotransferase, partial [Candidatus Woesebacteria bacterium]|nr:phosphotransferase [Candidatus Woesebacteria bacterium]
LWFVSVTAAVDTGVLLGLHKFKQLSVILLTETLVFFLGTVLLVELGLAEYLYITTPLSAVLSFLMTWVALRASLRSEESESSSAVPSFPWKFYGHAVVMKFAAVAFVTIDVLLAKHFLSPGHAGQYVLLTVVGKMIYYASALFGQFVIPLVSKEIGAGRDPKKIFLALFLTTAFILTGSFLAVGVFGWLTVPILLGEKAQIILPHLPLYTFGMTCFGLTSLLISYYQSKENYVGSVISLLASAVMVVGIVLFHGSVWQISGVVALAGVLSFVSAILYRVIRLLPITVLFRMFSTQMYELLQHLFPVAETMVPAKIGQYSYDQSLADSEKKSSYAYGIYRRGSVRAIAKVWTGKFYTADYWRLRNEIAVVSAVSDVTNEIKKLVNVSVPTLLHFTESPVQLATLQRLIPAKPAKSLVLQDVISITGFLQHVSTKIPAKVFQKIDSRTGAALACLMPLVTIRAILANPRQRAIYFKAVLKFARLLPTVLAARASVLAHRDIHTENVLKIDKQLYLIDFGFAAVTVPGYDLVCTAILHWGDSALRKQLLSEIDSQSKTETQRNLNQAIGIYCALTMLCSRGTPKKVVHQYTNALKYWTEHGKMV